MNDKQDITPIEEVSYNEQVIMIPNEEEVELSNISNKKPKNEKLNTILLVLLFIFLFAFVFSIPYINEYIQKIKADSSLSQIEKDAKKIEEKQKQDIKTPVKPEKEIKTKEMVCTSSNTIDGYNIVKTQKFNYDSNNQVLSSSILVNYTFISQDDNYQQLKNRCDNDSLKYVDKPGYTMSCSYNDNNIEITNTFDLETYEPIIEDDNIVVNAVYKQRVNTLKDKLVKEGYICQ